jgi:hypothetical protein
MVNPFAIEIVLAARSYRTSILLVDIHIYELFHVCVPQIDCFAKEGKSPTTRLRLRGHSSMPVNLMQES